MTVLTFGCSIAHGADTQELGNHPDNIKHSYSALVAEHLQQPLENYAFCGNSNENIFHAAVKKISQVPNITAVIVGWTSPVRETWECDERTWQVIPSWCGTTEDLYKPFEHFKRDQIAGARYQMCADKFEHIQSLDEIYKCLIKYKFDEQVYSEKTTNYMLTLKAYCKEKNIKLLETSWHRPIEGTVDLAQIGDWIRENRFPTRHPNKEEHEQMAQTIIDFYKL